MEICSPSRVSDGDDVTSVFSFIPRDKFGIYRMSPNNNRFWTRAVSFTCHHRFVSLQQVQAYATKARVGTTSYLCCLHLSALRVTHPKKWLNGPQTQMKRSSSQWVSTTVLGRKTCTEYSYTVRAAADKEVLGDDESYEDFHPPFTYPVRAESFELAQLD